MIEGQEFQGASVQTCSNSLVQERTSSVPEDIWNTMP
jgi:hypothetical protein